MKSLLVSVFWPAWVWLKYPGRKFIFGSYASSLATRDSRKCRDLISSEWYRKNFRPAWNLKEDTNTMDRFENTEGGHRIAVGVGGRLTGEGGDYLVGDDLLNVMDAYSAKVREFTTTWLKEAFSTRKNNPKRYAILLIMQRLHVDDPAGHAQKEGDWDELRLPGEYDPAAERPKPTKIGWTDWRTQAGELLWPERCDEAWLKNEKKNLGSYGFAGQIQQSPAPIGGGLIKRKWWLYYREKPKVFTRIVQFWDTAQEPGVSNDYSVCATWGLSANGAAYLLHVMRAKLETPDLERAAINLYVRFRPHAIVVEKKSSGASLIQYLRRAKVPGIAHALPVIPYDPEGRSKVVRAAAASPFIEAGNCYLPEVSTFDGDDTDAFVEEHERFPNAPNDDRVDTTSMMVEHFRNNLTTEGPRVLSL